LGQILERNPSSERHRKFREAFKRPMTLQGVTLNGIDKGPSSARSYWVVCFTLKTWAEALAAGGDTVGFRSSSKGSFQKMAIGDYLLCYLIGVSRFVAIQEVNSEVFIDDSPIWKDDSFPFRVKVKEVVRLEPETAVPVIHLCHQLSIFQNLKSLGAWAVHFRTSPKKWKEEDSKAVLTALREAKKNPLHRSLQDRERLINTGLLGDAGE
jgi:hypothetical protein